MQKTNATDKYVTIIAFIPSQPFGAQPQKAEAKSKANVTLKVIISLNTPLNIRITPANFLPVITELSNV
jgi:hypothetical protein